MDQGPIDIHIQIGEEIVISRLCPVNWTAERQSRFHSLSAQRITAEALKGVHTALLRAVEAALAGTAEGHSTGSPVGLAP